VAFGLPFIRSLAKANEELIANNDELRTVVMLNCGGTIDLSTLFNFKGNSEQGIILFFF